MISANESYKIAYEAHYKKKNLNMAYALYQQILENYPNTDEVKYAKQQLSNLEKHCEDRLLPLFKSKVK